MNLSELNNNQKISFGVCVILTIAVCIYLIFTLLQTNYLAVYEDDNLSNVANVTKVLDEQSVPYKLSQSGSRVEVPSELEDKVNVELAHNNYGSTDSNGFELFDELDYSMTEQAQKVTFLRAIQGELERTIESYKEVEKARVHIALPKQKLFTAEQKIGTAAVSLWFTHNQNFNQKQVLSIRQLVASSIDGLSADSVVILNGSGQQISKANEQTKHIDFMEQKTILETYYKNKASDLLSLYFNASQYAISVSITLNEQHIKEISNEIVIPSSNKDGVITRKKQSEFTESQSTKRDKTLNKSVEVEYQHGRKTQELETRPGGIKHISTAVAISAEVSNESLLKLRSLMFAGLGLSNKREDRLSLEFISINNVVPSPLEQTVDYESEIISSTVIPPKEQTKIETKALNKNNDAKNILIILAVCFLVCFIVFIFFKLMKNNKENANQEQVLLELNQWLDTTKVVENA